MTTLWLALAGGLGAGARHAVDAWVRPRLSDALPWSTQLINVTGSFLLGVLVGAGSGDPWHAVLGTGLLGGYTTFSTASVETAHLVLDRRYRAAGLHAVGMLVLAVAAATAGHALGRATA